jgi:hypothetical protein
MNIAIVAKGAKKADNSIATRNAIQAWVAELGELIGGATVRPVGWFEGNVPEANTSVIVIFHLGDNGESYPIVLLTDAPGDKDGNLS